MQGPAAGPDDSLDRGGVPSYLQDRVVAIAHRQAEAAKCLHEKADRLLAEYAGSIPAASTVALLRRLPDLGSGGSRTV